MKNKFIFILILLLQIPLFVNAKSDEMNFEEVVSINTKYYKTTTFIPNNSVMSNNLILFNRSITNTIEISEEEYNNSDFQDNLNSSSSTQTEYKKLTITIQSNGSKYKYTATLEWKKMPATRSYDILGISFYNSVSVSSISYETYYCLSSGNCISNNQYSTVYGSNGIGVVFQLPTSKSMTSLKNTLSLVIDKNTSATIKEQKALADYSHAVSSISLNSAKNFDISLSGGIVLSDSLKNYYDEIAPVATTLSCNW